MTTINELSATYVSRQAELDPIGATARGITGHDHEMTDFSPDGYQARADNVMSTLAELDSIAATDRSEAVALEFHRERLDGAVAAHTAGDWLRHLASISTPVQGPRKVFDLMAQETSDQWETIASRLMLVPAALSSLIETLRLGIDRDVVAARRQALECAAQAETWANNGWFAAYVQAAPIDLSADAAAADVAYGALASFLRDEYAPAATTQDAVGPERYTRAASAHLGTELDFNETYEWGWEEFERISDEMAATAAEIVPAGSVNDAIALLDADDDRVVHIRRRAPAVSSGSDGRDNRRHAWHPL